MSFDHRDQRWWGTRCDRCMNWSDIVNPSKSIYKADRNGWFKKNTKRSEVQMQVDTDPQVIKVVLIEGRERDK